MPNRADARATRLPSRPEPDQASSRTGQHGVRGWLLVLCLMLTVIGPVLAVGLMANEYASFSKYFASSVGVHAAILASLTLGVSSVAFGIHAGIRLWNLMPGAVGTAKKALLFGLVVDLLVTAIDLAATPSTEPGAVSLHRILFYAAPSLIFFTASYAYLNKSTRVWHTYGGR